MTRKLLLVVYHASYAYAAQPALLHLVYRTGFACLLAEHFVGGREEGYGGGGYQGLDQLHVS